MTLLQLLALVAAFGALVAWLVAVVSALAMSQHRAPGVSAFYLLTHGLAFFDQRFFTAAGNEHRVRLVKAFGVFFGFVFLGMILGVIGAG